MTRVVGTLLVASLAGLAATGLAADAGKLRYVTAIYFDAKGTGMRQPEGVACNDRSTLIVGDTGRGRLLRYTVDERDVKPAGEIQAPEVSLPARVQMNSKDELFVLDGKQRRIARFDAKGAFKEYLSPEGIPAPSTVVPRSFKIDRADSIYVLDVFSARVLVLDRDAKYQRHVPFPEEYGFFSDLAVDSRGTMYLLDSVKGAVITAQKDAKTFAPLTKTLRSHASFPTAMTVDARGVLYLVDENGGGIVLVGQDGSVLGRQLAMGWSDGLLYYPSQVCITEKGQLFVADRGNHRVQVFAIVR
jgi:sugar lactone lactonase YvrE